MRNSVRWLAGMALAVMIFLVVAVLVRHIIPTHLASTAAERTEWGLGAGTVVGGVFGFWVDKFATQPQPKRRSVEDGESDSGVPPSPSTGDVVVEGMNEGIASTGNNTLNWQGAGQPPDGLHQAVPKAGGGASAPQGSGAIRIPKGNSGIASTGHETINIQNRPK